LDVKVGVVGLLEAAKTLLESGYSPRRTLLLAFGHDEEVGGTAGAAHIAGEGKTVWEHSRRLDFKTRL
jgi:carboxypeptidase PM20D1